MQSEEKNLLTKLEEARQVGDPLREVNTLVMLGDLANLANKLVEAKEYYLQALEIASRYRDYKGINILQERLDTLKRDSTTNKDIIRRIDEIHLDLGNKLDELKIGQSFIYQRLGVETRLVVDTLLKELQQHRIEQAQMQRTLDAIRRALRHIQLEGLPLYDNEVKDMLTNIYESVNSTSDLKQQLELTLPVIPFLLEYKIGLDAGIDLSAVWEELLEHIRRNKD